MQSLLVSGRITCLLLHSLFAAAPILAVVHPVGQFLQAMAALSAVLTYSSLHFAVCSYSEQQ